MIFETFSGAILNTERKVIYFNNLPTITVFNEIKKLWENDDEARKWDIYGLLRGGFKEIPNLMYKGKPAYSYDLILREDWTKVETKEEVE